MPSHVLQMSCVAVSILVGFTIDEFIQFLKNRGAFANEDKKKST